MGRQLWARLRNRRSEGNDRSSVSCHMHVCAHTDDDLYFMAPDLFRSLETADQVVGVYLTAGEADGRNVATNAANRDASPVDFAGYAAARQRGLRAAYAQVLRGDADAVWDRRTFRTQEGFPGEVAVLAGTPNVTLYFLNLRMVAGTPPRRIRTLWSGEVDSQPSLVPTGSPIPGDVHHATRADVLHELLEILRTHQPTLLRVMDPDPDHVSLNGHHATYCDHEDHTASALFALEAARRYDAEGHPQPLVMESYRGYWNKLWPHNLTPTAFAEKMAAIGVYGGADGRVSEHGVDAGDFQLGDRAYNRGYGQSTTTRYGQSTSWMARAGDDRLHAFTVIDGRPVSWAESAPGQEFRSERQPLWNTPTDDSGSAAAEAGFFSPHLAAVCARDGRIHVFGVRLVMPADPFRHRRELVTSVQESPGGRFGPWTDLGNHNWGASQRQVVQAREMGQPFCAVQADGQIVVAVRNFGTGLSLRTRALDGTWSAWTDLAGSGTQDGLAWTVGPQETSEIFAPRADGVLRWHQTRVGGSYTRDYSLPFATPAGPLNIALLEDGRRVLLMRQPTTSWVLAYVDKMPGGPWLHEPRFLGTPGGTGPIAATSVPGTPSALALVTRNDSGTTSVGWFDADVHEPVTWTDWGPSLVHSPSVAVDAEGRIAVAVLGTDGRPHVGRQEHSGYGKPIETRP